MVNANYLRGNSEPLSAFQTQDSRGDRNGRARPLWLFKLFDSGHHFYNEEPKHCNYILKMYVLSSPLRQFIHTVKKKEITSVKCE